MRLLHATVLALVLVAPGCLSGYTSAGTGPSAASSSLPMPIVATSLRFHDHGISFRYPALWKPMRCRAMVTSFLTDVVVLTTTKPQPVCSDPDIRPAGGWPPHRLEPNGIDVAWSYYGFPGVSSLASSRATPRASQSGRRGSP